MTWPLRSHKFLFVEIQRYFTIYLIICTNTPSNLSQHSESNFDKSFLLTRPSQITSFVRNQALKILRRVHFNVHSLRKSPGCHTFSGFFRVDWPFGEIAAWFSNRRLHFYPSPSRLGSTFSRTRALAGSPRNLLALAKLLDCPRSLRPNYNSDMSRWHSRWQSYDWSHAKRLRVWGKRLLEARPFSTPRLTSPNT